MTVTKNLNRANSSLKHSLVINNLIEYASRKKKQKKNKENKPVKTKQCNGVRGIFYWDH